MSGVFKIWVTCSSYCGGWSVDISYPLSGTNTLRGFLAQNTPTLLGDFMFTLPANKATHIYDPVLGLINYALQLGAVSNLLCEQAGTDILLAAAVFLRILGVGRGNTQGQRTSSHDAQLLV